MSDGHLGGSVARLLEVESEWRAKAIDLRRMHLHPQADICDMHADELAAALAPAVVPSVDEGPCYCCSEDCRPGCRCYAKSASKERDDELDIAHEAAPPVVAPVAAPVQEQTIEALEFAHGAILDAIGLEDGLDGAAGAAVLKMLRAALAANGRTPPDYPKEDEPVECVPFLTAPEGGWRERSAGDGCMDGGGMADVSLYGSPEEVAAPALPLTGGRAGLTEEVAEARA